MTRTKAVNDSEQMYDNKLKINSTKEKVAPFSINNCLIPIHVKGSHKKSAFHLTEGSRSENSSILNRKLKGLLLTSHEKKIISSEKAADLFYLTHTHKKSLLSSYSLTKFCPQEDNTLTNSSNTNTR